MEDELSPDERNTLADQLARLQDNYENGTEADRLSILMGLRLEIIRLEYWKREALRLREENQRLSMALVKCSQPSDAGLLVTNSTTCSPRSSPLTTA